MGAWSGEPFGNDIAADWSWELDDATDWDVVRGALINTIDQEPGELDADSATIAIAAAEVVAHGLGHPTQTDAYTESVEQFVERVHPVPPSLRQLAVDALSVATHSDGELATLWADDSAGWANHVSELRRNLTSET